MVMPVMVPAGRGLDFEDTLDAVLGLEVEFIGDAGAAMQAEDVVAAPWL